MSKLGGDNDNAIHSSNENHKQQQQKATKDSAAEQPQRNK
jgi:hypothetical protein